MAYVAPNSTIELMSGVNLTPDYKDTIYFASESAQSVYFAGKIVKRFNNQMYTRISDGVCRVECNASEIRYCDYIRFRNDRVIETNKYYYGFITKIEYINENVTEITFEIDELQTWLYNQYCSLGKCFIERQHCATSDDNAGDNLVPEPLPVQENIVSRRISFQDMSGIRYIFAIGCVKAANSEVQASPFYTQSLYTGMASAVAYVVVTSSNFMALLNACELDNGFIKGLFGVDDLWNILSVYAVPSDFFTTGGTAITIKGIQCNLLGTAAIKNTIQGDRPTVHGNVVTGTYTPRNKKLLTYPYAFLRVETPVTSQDYKSESFFGSGTPYFNVISTVNPIPTLSIFPHNYGGIYDDARVGMTIDNFPLLNAYQSGVLGTVGQTVINTLKTALMAIAAGFAGGVAEGEAGSFDVSYAKKEIKNPISPSPKEVKSQGGNTSLAAIMSAGMLPNSDVNFNISVYQMGLRKEIAELYDDYLSMYGYAQNKVDTPNLHVRSKWTYVKTSGAIVNGGIPSTAKRKISAILDSGITFWDSSVTVGDYGNMDNP